MARLGRLVMQEMCIYAGTLYGGLFILHDRYDNNNIHNYDLNN